METKTARGKFIVFEGSDKAGKTSQVSKLCENLHRSGISHAKIAFPDRTTFIGDVIDTALNSGEHYSIEGKPLNHKALTLLFSANRWEHADKIINLLNRGVNVICDRWSFSGVAYAIAANGDYGAVENEFGLPAPDAVHCFVFGDKKEQLKRLDAAECTESTETPEIQTKVNAEYKTMGDSKWLFHDATTDAARLSEIIHEHTQKLLANDVGNIKKLSREDFWVTAK